MSKDNPTNGELKIMLENLTDMFSDLKKIALDTNEKATKTNGRVTRLEEHDEKAVKALFDEQNGLITWRERMWGWIKGVTVAGTILFVVVPILFTLYIKNLKSEIVTESSEKTIALIEERWDPIIK